MYISGHNTNNFEQIHWNQLFCGMYGLVVMLSFSTSKNIDEITWEEEIIIVFYVFYELTDLGVHTSTLCLYQYTFLLLTK